MQTHAPKLALSILACVALFAVDLARPAASRAQAETVTPVADEYQATVENALREFEAHNYEEAYALFTRAHELRPSARTERALGKACFELRRYIEATRWLEAALEDERSPLTEDMRTETLGILARARSFVGTIVVHTPVAGAEVLVDTVPVEGDPAGDPGVVVRLDLGVHEVVVRAPGYLPETRRVEVHGDDTQTLSLELAEDTAGIIRVEVDPGAIYRDVGTASLIAGGAFVVIGIVATSIWADTVNTLNANVAAGSCNADVDPVTESLIPIPGRGPVFPTCSDQESRYRLALPFIYVGFIGAGAFLAAGLGLILGAPGPTTETAEDVSLVSCGPFADLGVSCVGSF
jgi:hypothetical protein